jgi:hypothetical protein
MSWDLWRYWIAGQTNGSYAARILEKGQRPQELRIPGTLELGRCHARLGAWEQRRDIGR